MGAWGVGGGGSKGRWLERRERGRIGDGLGEWDRGEGGRMVMGAGRYISQLREPFYGDFILEGSPGSRRSPQIFPWATEKRVPELALVHNHTDEYFAYHHSTFIWRWIEIETETHIGVLY